MEFKKYQHVERFGTDEVDGIEVGICYVFPKIDGTNASIWLGDNGEICGGSRNRQVSLDKDNQGFFEWLLKQENIAAFLHKYSDHRLYGEWLVPHSLKTYREDAWRNFYCFDVMVGDEYLPYEQYKEKLDEFDIDYIAPLGRVKDGSYENFVHFLDKNNFLIEDGKGEGEGVVIKNYDFTNRFGRTTWAKLVTSKFKEKHHKEMGAPLHEHKPVERDIVDSYVTPGRVNKVFNKIRTECDGWRSQYIPRLLQTVYYDLVTEESWNFVKEHKNPKINFGTLKHMTIEKTKEHKPELF